jgi:WXG100 family type VII secretion target
MQHAQDLERYTAQIDEFTNTLETAVAPMVAANGQGSWDGAAKDQYFIEKKNWDDAIARMRANLTGMGAGLVNIHDNTLHTENKNTLLFNNGTPY